MPLRPIVRDKFGAVYSYIRVSNGRDPARDFLDGLEKELRLKFEGNFGFFTKTGASDQNIYRFHPLHNDGKPLWEFKEHAYHLYVIREVFNLILKNAMTQQIAVAILLNGWKKEKGGQGKKEEQREIQTAKNLYNEYSGVKVRHHDGTQESMGTAAERKARH